MSRSHSVVLMFREEYSIGHPQIETQDCVVAIPTLHTGIGVRSDPDKIYLNGLLTDSGDVEDEGCRPVLCWYEL